jgi:hypothetical protein
LLLRDWAAAACLLVTSGFGGGCRPTGPSEVGRRPVGLLAPPGSGGGSVLLAGPSRARWRCRPAPPSRVALGRGHLIHVDLASPVPDLSSSSTTAVAGSTSSWWWSREACAWFLQLWSSRVASWWRSGLRRASSLARVLRRWWGCAVVWGHMCFWFGILPGESLHRHFCR